MCVVQEFWLAKSSIMLRGDRCISERYLVTQQKKDSQSPVEKPAADPFLTQMFRRLDDVVPFDDLL